MTTFLIRRALRAGILVLTVSLAMPLTSASSDTLTATKVRVVRTSRWVPPSSDPSGLAYLGGRKALIVVDSEIDETNNFAGVNVWIAKPGGRVLKTLHTDFSDEPTDVAVSGSGQVLFITDDVADSITVWRKGGDKAWGTADDLISTINTRLFPSRDPTGIGFGARSLFITDGDNQFNKHEVYRLRPGPNGVFDGVAPEGDDILTSFDTVALGITRPSDVAFKKGSRHLFIVSSGSGEKVIVETTLKGALVNTYDMSATTIRNPAGVTWAPASRNPDILHIYVADRGIDNSVKPNENDGRIFEFALP